MLANGTFVNASIVASGIGDVYVIGVENAVSVNLAGTASVTIAAEAGGDHTHSLGAPALNHMLDHIASLQCHVEYLRRELAQVGWKDGLTCSL